MPTSEAVTREKRLPFVPYEKDKNLSLKKAKLLRLEFKNWKILKYRAVQVFQVSLNLNIKTYKLSTKCPTVIEAKGPDFKNSKLKADSNNQMVNKRKMTKEK